jgi:hypothetical protein
VEFIVTACRWSESLSPESVTQKSRIWEELCFAALDALSLWVLSQWPKKPGSEGSCVLMLDLVWVSCGRGWWGVSYLESWVSIIFKILKLEIHIHTYVQLGVGKMIFWFSLHLSQILAFCVTDSGLRDSDLRRLSDLNSTKCFSLTPLHIAHDAT